MQSPRLTSLDATFLELEDADMTAHMHIGAALVFRPAEGGRPPTVDELRELIAARLPALPVYTCRLSQPRPHGLRRPRWVEDTGCDLAQHVKAATLPRPGGREELYAWAADYWSGRLDRTRPLWQVALLTGLEDGAWAICTKFHHCLVDGVGAVDAAHLFLDSEPDSSTRVEAGELGDNGGSTLLRLPGVVVRGVRAGIDAARHPSKVADVLGQSRSIADLIGEELVAAPKTSLNAPIGVHRRFDATRIPLADVKLIKDELGGTVNDVVLAAAAAGLRELLLERGEDTPVAGLRAMVPVNVRAAGETAGNRVSSLFVNLPVAESNPLRRYARTADQTKALKSGGQARGGDTLVQFADLAPPVLHSLLARTLFAARLFNVTITNVPGPRVPLYAFGSRLTEILPLVPLAADHGVGIAVVSYDGDLFFGLVADRDGAPDIAVLRRGIDDAVAELREFATRPRASVRAAE